MTELILWRWSVPKDEWEYVATASAEKKTVVGRGYKKRDRPGVRFKWTSGPAPKKFRTRVKKEK